MGEIYCKRRWCSQRFSIFPTLSFYFPVRLLPFFPETIIFLGNSDSELCSLPGKARFANGHAGDREDLPDKEQAKTGILAKSLSESLIFILNPDAHSIVFDNEDEVIPFILIMEPDFAYSLATPDRVVQEVVHDFDEKGIGENLKVPAFVFNPDLLVVQFGFILPDSCGDTLLCRIVNSQLLVILGEFDLLAEHAGKFVNL